MKPLVLAVLGSCLIVQAAHGQHALKSSPQAAPSSPLAVPTAASADDFHRLLARAAGHWTGHATMRVSLTAPPLTTTSHLTNTMAMGGLFQVSEITYTTNGEPIHGIRVTGYDAPKKIFTRAMIQDGGNGVVMEGPWDPATKSTTMRYKQRNKAGQEASMKEVYTFVDENTELLELYRLEEQTSQEIKILTVRWTRDPQ
jgi:hypothetical protein